MAKARKARNHILHLLFDSGAQVTDIAGIRGMAPKFLSNLFNQSHYWPVFLNLTVKRILTEEASR